MLFIFDIGEFNGKSVRLQALYTFLVWTRIKLFVLVFQEKEIESEKEAVEITLKREEIDQEETEEVKGFVLVDNCDQFLARVFVLSETP